MKMFVDVPLIYLHRQPVDFRKSINGLTLIVETEMQLSPFSEAVFLFVNSAFDKLKLLYWDNNGFVLFYKRLEQTRFSWPKSSNAQQIMLTEQELIALLDADKYAPWQQINTDDIEL